jgi:hypothetical protein
MAEGGAMKGDWVMAGEVYINLENVVLVDSRNLTFTTTGGTTVRMDPKQYGAVVRHLEEKNL